MSQVTYVAQPNPRSTLEVIEALSKVDDLVKLDVAVAYITSSGIYDLLKVLDSALHGKWRVVQKRWLTSFDYCRTQPIALKALLSLPASSVRVHDAHFCIAHGGMPKVPFHPKAFMFRGRDFDSILTGSGNLSRSGLSKGVEAGLALTVRRRSPAETTSATSIKAIQDWYASAWSAATILDAPLLLSYTNLFEQAGNLATPNITEDDLASVDTSPGALSSKALQKLRVCSSLWIEAGNITKNRGPKLPGNQLMMKRLSRVFFGFSPTSVAENTVIGGVDIQFQTGSVGSYTLSYSDNKMDKLNLPMPGTIGPTAYDNECLIFRQIAPQVFRLEIGTKADRAGWLKRSKAIGGDFRMSSGREWGVF